MKPPGAPELWRPQSSVSNRKCRWGRVEGISMDGCWTTLMQYHQGLLMTDNKLCLLMIQERYFGWSWKHERSEHYNQIWTLAVKWHPLCRPQLFQSKDAPNKTTTPEEFIRMTKGITMATAKAVAAGNSARQEDIIHTANLSRKAISDMLTTCKVLFYTLPRENVCLFFLVFFFIWNL